MAFWSPSSMLRRQSPAASARLRRDAGVPHHLSPIHVNNLGTTARFRPSNPAVVGLIRSTEADDPLLQASSLTGVSQEYTQLTCGSFLGRTVDLSLGSVQVFWETMNQAVDQKNLILSEAFTIGMCVHAGSTWQNRQLNPGTLFLLPPRNIGQLRTPANSDTVVATIDRLEFQRQAEQRFHIDADALFREESDRALDAETAAKFRSALIQLLISAAQAPHTLNYTTVRKSMSDDVIELCIQALSHSIEGGRQTRDSHRVHRAMVERAREFILATPASAPTVTDLCAHLNMSQRGLHYAFMQVLQINPARFIRNVRLHGVRKDILDGAESVSAAAFRWGFWHMGMLSRYYKELFGELPSQTAKKMPQLRPVHWLTAE